MAVVNAILQGANRIQAGMTGQDAPNGDALRKTLDQVKDMLLPHYAEDTEERATEAKKVLAREVSQGPLKYTVVGGDSKRRRRKRDR